MAVVVTSTVDEAASRKAVAFVPAPKGVRLPRLLVDEDYSGDPAIYVFFGVSKRIKLNRTRIDELGRFRRAVTDAIDKLHTHRLPYVKFEDVS